MGLYSEFYPTSSKEYNLFAWIRKKHTLSTFGEKQRTIYTTFKHQASWDNLHAFLCFFSANEATFERERSCNKKNGTHKPRTEQVFPLLYKISFAYSIQKPFPLHLSHHSVKVPGVSLQSTQQQARVRCINLRLHDMTLFIMVITDII